MDRMEMARRRFAELTNLEDKLRLVLEVELSDELVEMLPRLIDIGACSFATYNTPCDRFGDKDVQPDNGGLYVWLEFHLGTTHASINFAGLTKRTADTGAAAVTAILTKKLGGRGVDYYDAMQVTMTAADVYALRTHCPNSLLRERVELSAFYHALKGPVAVGVALSLLPEHHTTHRVPADQQLVPVAEHLCKIGIEQIIIDQMIQTLFENEETLVTLDKVVALAGIFQGKADKKLAELLRGQLMHILDLHFQGNQRFDLSTNMDWLVEHGLIARNILSTHGQDRTMFDTTLVEQLSHGRLAAVHQFLARFVIGGEPNRIDRKVVQDAYYYTRDLLPKAFQTAMACRNYGTAAAIAQETADVTEEDRLRAIELSIVHNERIRVDWSYILR